MADGKFNIVQSLTILLNSYSKYLNVTWTSPLSSISIIEYLFEDAANTIDVMKQLEDDVLVCAHTHIPCVKKYEDKLLINVGSVGKAKIGKPNPTYSIIEIEEMAKFMSHLDI